MGSPRLTALLEAAQVEFDHARRMTMYRAIEEFFVTEAIVLPISHSLEWILTHPRLGGAELSYCRPLVDYAELYFRR